VIGNGLDLPVSPREKPLLFREYRADLWVGIVANLKPIKRIDLFLRALAHLSSNGNGMEIRAVILGEGRLRGELVQLATELRIAGLVHFMGAQENVSDYLHGIDIGVLCSDREGLPNAVLEYMACGLPVVVTSVGGTCELVDETNGLCVPAGDYLALGDALTRLVSSAPLRAMLGKKSLDKVRNSSTWDKIMPQWESYYRSLAGQPNC
jgi:glycosyltransferase involved in cell wall biosynthesis